MAPRSRRRMSDLADLYFAKIEPDLNSGCWLWAGSIGTRGYARIAVGGREVAGHRLGWEIHNGPIPEGLFACHRCDTPACVNPRHIFLGTNQQNTADRDSKNRTARGERSGVAKLTDGAVAEVWRLRKLGLLHREIAAQVGVSKSLISEVLKRRLWRHVSLEGVA